MADGAPRELKAVFLTAREFADEWEKNISKGGIFLKVDTPPKAREKVTVVVEITDIGESVALPGEAVHITPHGTGIHLDPFTDEVDEKIKSIIGGGGSEGGGKGGDQSISPDQQSVWQRVASMSRHEKAALARKGTMEERNVLIRDRDPFIVQNVLQNPRITIPEIIQLTKSQSLTLDQIKFITRQTEWMAVEEVRLNMVLNPKTPQPTAMSLLRKLSDKNLRMIAKRPMKQQIKAAALKLVLEKQGVRK